MDPRDLMRQVLDVIPGPYPRTTAYLVVAVLVITAIGLR